MCNTNLVMQVKVNVFLTDMDDFERMNKMYATFFENAKVKPVSWRNSYTWCEADEQRDSDLYRCQATSFRRRCRDRAERPRLVDLDALQTTLGGYPQRLSTTNGTRTMYCIMKRSLCHFAKTTAKLRLLSSERDSIILEFTQILRFQ